MKRSEVKTDAKTKDTCIFSIAITALILAMTESGAAITLEEYLQQVQKKNKTFQSLEASKEAAGTRFSQADLELSPILSANASYLDDKSQQTSGTSLLTHQQLRTYSLGLGKKFSTGTAAKVEGTLSAVNQEGRTGNTDFTAEGHIGTMGVSLSQSLWKNFFGNATRLRHERESLLTQSEKTSYDLQAQQALITAEAAFWDLLYLQQELEIRKASLERARKIEGWVRNRAGNGIGDRADVLNSQGLVAARELALIGTRDDLRAAEQVFIDQIEWTADQTVPALQGNLEQARILKAAGEGAKVVRLDTYLSVLEAQAKQVSARETEDQLRPDLVLSGQYKTNGYDSDDSGALSKMNDGDYPVSSVGLTFTWALDWDLNSDIRHTSSKDALAAQLKRDRSLLEGETAWIEINRRHGELSARIKAAENLSQVQTAKAAAERDKLSKGRSITSNVITAEQDAADAELTLTKLKVEQRKLEAQSRLFVKIQEVQ